MVFSPTKHQSNRMQYHQIKRDFWINRIEQAWKRKSVIWLSGVRRAGKTVLCQSLDDIEYFDCELPRTRRLLEDPEAFLQDLEGKRIVLDEIHRLSNPSELLKIAADHFPKSKIIATGSSTLGTSSKFQDTLTGRKERVWLTPILHLESNFFGDQTQQHRFLFGGLPPYFLSEKLPEHDYQDWIDSYWAKDIQELFRLEKRHSFHKFVELILTQSGSMFEATRFSTPCEASRSTIMNYLSVLEATHVAHVIRPFNTHRTKEIVSAPRVYGFDTGFICHYRGWLTLRREDLGNLWEHIVLNEIHGLFYPKEVRYWRDKQGHEIDFILLQYRNSHPITIDCKWKSTAFDPINLKAFRRFYPEGDNYVISYDLDKPFHRQYDELKVSFIPLSQISKFLS